MTARAAAAVGALRRRPELLIFLAMIAVCNAPVLMGSSWPGLMFHPAAVQSGEWWRLLTHPFVHVTWYHLLLDGTAFLLLYHSLLEPSLWRRLLYVVAGAGGSLACSWAGTGSASGLCGLSGIAHGLMAVSAIELIARHPAGSAERRLGWWSFGLVVVKAGFEALSGRMFFGFLDFGLLGEPVAVSHAGGIIGGLTVLLGIPSIRRGNPVTPTREAAIERLPDRTEGLARPVAIAGWLGTKRACTTSEPALRGVPECAR